MDAVVEDDEGGPASWHLRAVQLWMEVDDDDEGVQRKPAHAEQRNDNDQHLYHLQIQ